MWSSSVAGWITIRKKSQPFDLEPFRILSPSKLKYRRFSTLHLHRRRSRGEGEKGPTKYVAGTGDTNVDVPPPPPKKKNMLCALNLYYTIVA